MAVHGSKKHILVAIANAVMEHPSWLKKVHGKIFSWLLS
jgi:hypothetical protein